MSVPSDLYDSNWLWSDGADIKNYLYMAGDDSQPIFQGVQEEMAQLNDFCLLCIDGTSKHLAELQRTVKRYRDGKERADHPEFGDVSNKVVSALENFYIPRWQDTETFLVRAMCLILLSAFTEKSLKDLALYLAPAEAPRFKRKAGEAEIGALVQCIKRSVSRRNPLGRVTPGPLESFGRLVVVGDVAEQFAA